MQWIKVTLMLEVDELVLAPKRQVVMAMAKDFRGTRG